MFYLILIFTVLLIFVSVTLLVYGIFVFVSSLRNRRRKLLQTPITLVMLAEQLWLKNPQKKLPDRKGQEEVIDLPVAADAPDKSPIEEAGDENSLPAGNKAVPGPGKLQVVPPPVSTPEKSVPEKSVPEKSSMDSLRKLVEPYNPLLAEQKADTIVHALLDILDKHRGRPSIVINKADEEFIELADIAEALAGVPLVTHTETVTRLMIDMCGKEFSEPDKMMPVVLVAAVGHDIGKTRGGNHPDVSAAMLSEMIPEERVWKRRVIHAVKNHHGEVDEQLSTMLKAGDMKARGYELSSAMPGDDVKSFEDWFDCNSFLKRYIEPEINITQMHSCNAFSLDSIVYVKADFIYGAAHRMCRDMKILDVRFFYPSENDSVIRSIVKALRDGNYVHKALVHDVFTLKYELIFDMPAVTKPTMQLVPLKGEAFDLEGAEGRKTDFLVTLREVRIVGKEKK